MIAFGCARFPLIYLAQFDVDIFHNARIYCLSYTCVGSFAVSSSHPKVHKDQPVYVLSYYFDRAVDLGLVPKDSISGQVLASNC